MRRAVWCGPLLTLLACGGTGVADAGPAGACAEPVEVSGGVAADGYVHALGNTAAGAAVEQGSCGGGDGLEEVFRVAFPGGGSIGRINVTGLDGERLDGVVFYLRETCEAATERACSRSGVAASVSLSASRSYLLFVDGPAPLPDFAIVFGAILWMRSALCSAPWSRRASSSTRRSRSCARTCGSVAHPSGRTHW